MDRGGGDKGEGARERGRLQNLGESFAKINRWLSHTCRTADHPQSTLPRNDRSWNIFKELVDIFHQLILLVCMMGLLNEFVMIYGIN